MFIDNNLRQNLQGNFQLTESHLSLVFCTNSRASDIANAARVFREASKNGETAKVHPNVEFYLAAASKAEQKIAEEAGDWQVLEQAGAKVLPSGCAVCIGLGAGLLPSWLATGISLAVSAPA